MPTIKILLSHQVGMFRLWILSDVPDECVDCEGLVRPIKRKSKTEINEPILTAAHIIAGVVDIKLKQKETITFPPFSDLKLIDESWSHLIGRHLFLSNSGQENVSVTKGLGFEFEDFTINPGERVHLFLKYPKDKDPCYAVTI